MLVGCDIIHHSLLRQRRTQDMWCMGQQHVVVARAHLW